MHKIFIRSESFLVVSLISGLESYHVQIGSMTSCYLYSFYLCPLFLMLMVGLLECMPVHHVDTVDLGNPEEGLLELELELDIY